MEVEKSDYQIENRSGRWVGLAHRTPGKTEQGKEKTKSRTLPRTQRKKKMIIKMTREKMEGKEDKSRRNKWDPRGTAGEA